MARSTRPRHEKQTTNRANRGLTAGQRLFDGLLALLFGVALGFLVLRNAAHYGDVFPMLWRDYLANRYIVFLNVAPVAFASVVLWVLIGRVWLSSLITGTVFLMASFGNYFKIYFRGDPVVAADMTILREVGNISSRYPIELTGWMLKAIAVTVAAVILTAIPALTILLIIVITMLKNRKNEI